jgi:hypothetical protein
MSKANPEDAKPDPFDETRDEVVAMAQRAIKDQLLPLQTKKLSKKMIEQIAAECAAQIAEGAITVSRKAASRRAAQLTSDFSKILKDEQLPAMPIFNDKLATVARQLTPEDIERIKSDRDIAARVVSRVYKSIFDFALDIGIKAMENRTESPDPNPSKKK